MKKVLSEIEPYMPVLVCLLALKLVFMGMFSSDYQDELFIPFVNTALNHLNPWEYVFQNHLPYEFPYHSLMLYILLPFKFIIKFFHISNLFLVNFIFKIPVLAADLAIFYILVKLFPGKVKEVIVFYFTSAIVFYSSFIHSQLDLIPMAILVLSIYYLKRNKVMISSIFFALACCTKLHVLAVLPLILIYIGKKYGYKKFFGYIAVIVAIYGLFSLPYIFSEGYRHLVLSNPKQNLVFNSYFTFQNLTLYLLPMILGFVYFRFLSYTKINLDLLDSYCLFVFSLLLIFTASNGPAWYCWIVPFMSIFAIKYGEANKGISYSIFLLNLFYLIFFIFFHQTDYTDIIFLGKALDIKINMPLLANLSYTFLVMSLVALTYLIYKVGVKSNSIYKMSEALCIGVVGDSASGKTTLLNNIKALLGSKLIVLEGDGDHKWERGDENWEIFSHLNPKGNLLYKQVADLINLKQKKTVVRRDYNHNTGKFDKAELIKPKEFVLLSGLHAFYLPKIRKTIDLKIFLDPDKKLLTHWKIIRDMKERGYSKKEVLANIKKREKDAQKYIVPQKNFANVIFKYSADNDFEAGDENAKIDLKLNMVLDSSVYLSDIIDDLTQKDFLLDWEYSNDLKTQSLTVKISENFDVESILSEKIKNIDELLDSDVKFKKGSEGFIQLIVLRLITEELEHRYEQN